MGLDLHNVKIANDGYQVKNVFIDDKEIKGVTKITYTEEVESVNSIIIEMFVNKLEIEDCNEIDTLKEKIKKLENEIKQLKNKEWIDKIIPYEPYIPPKVWYYKYDKPLDHGDDGFFHLHL
jgi:predicted RNA-binding protein with EMAP domain